MDNRNEDDGSLGYVAYCAHGGEQWDNLSLSEQMKWEFAALAVADVVRAESQWQPIETAPKQGYFIGWDVGMKIPIMAIWSNKHQAYIGAGSVFDDEELSFWMPLPEPPK